MEFRTSIVEWMHIFCLYILNFCVHFVIIHALYMMLLLAYPSFKFTLGSYINFYSIWFFLFSQFITSLLLKKMFLVGLLDDILTLTTSSHLRWNLVFLLFSQYSVVFQWIGINFEDKFWNKHKRIKFRSYKDYIAHLPVTHILLNRPSQSFVWFKLICLFNFNDILLSWSLSLCFTHLLISKIKFTLVWSNLRITVSQFIEWKAIN